MPLSTFVILLLLSLAVIPLSHSHEPADLDVLEKIQRLEARVNELEQAIQASSSVRTSGGPAEASDPLRGSAEAIQSQQAAQLADSIDIDVQQRLVRSAFERTLIERGGLQLPSGVLEIEPALSYQNSSSDRIVVDGFTILPVLVVGDIVSERIQRQQSTLNGAFRLGLPRRTQLNLNIPYIYSESQIVTAENEERITSYAGLGDISLGLSWQALQSSGKWPDILTSLNWKFDNGRGPFDGDVGDIAIGSGNHSLDTRVTAVKVVDPVVYFGGVNYTHNFDTSQSVGNYEPGSSFGFNLGLAIALNLNSSLSLSYDQLFSRHGDLDGVEIPGSNSTVGILSIGGTYADIDYALDFSVGIGVTSDSPDILVRFAIPLRSRWDVW